MQKCIPKQRRSSQIKSTEPAVRFAMLADCATSGADADVRWA